MAEGDPPIPAGVAQEAAMAQDGAVAPGSERDPALRALDALHDHAAARD
jgi:hypothetical protein